LSFTLAQPVLVWGFRPTPLATDPHLGVLSPVVFLGGNSFSVFLVFGEPFFLVASSLRVIRRPSSWVEAFNTRSDVRYNSPPKGVSTVLNGDKLSSLFPMMERPKLVIVRTLLLLGSYWGPGIFFPLPQETDPPPAFPPPL